MTAAVAEEYLPISEIESKLKIAREGAQSLLAPQGGKPPYLLHAAGLALYALVMVAAVSYSAHPHDPVEQEPIELVMLPTPEAPVEPTPQIEEPPPPPPVAEAVPEPPPPLAAEPEPVAPVEPKPPVPEKKKVVERKPPVVQPRAAQNAAPHPTASQAPPPPNAMPSSYPGQVYARINRAAANTYPRAAMMHHESGRVSYHLVISPSGELLSKSITPSGNAAFDTAAAEALAHAAPFPAPGTTRPVSLSGAITYRLN